jgi:serine-type D-Ala-D-Ala carboxypeptidase/endopeptidase (penicillin-binding protein 4)
MGKYCNLGVRPHSRGGSDRATRRVPGWRLRVAALACLSLTTGCATYAKGAAGALESPRPERATKAVRELRTQLSLVFGARIMAHGAWGVDVRSLDTGESIFRLDDGRLMMPASNMKLVTLAAAAEIFGWDHRFTTTVETSGTIEGGVLRGDLFIRGGGDPTINARDGRAPSVLHDWASALRAAGIERIDGRIVGDDQAFDDEGLGQGWAWDYLQFGYAAPVGALQFNEDLASLTVTPGAEAGRAAQAALAGGAGLRVINRVTTGAVGSRNEIMYRRRLDEPVLEISGSVGAGAASESRTVAVVNPTLFTATSVRDALIERGIGVSGPAVDLDDVAAELAGSNGDRRVLITTSSPTLREIGTVLMKVSQNLYAETLVKAIGAGNGGLGTFEGGLNRVRETLTSWGIAQNEYVLADGSGLSRYNYVSAGALSTILERMYKDARHREAFLATLPIAGRDGTLSTRMRRTRAEGNVRAKTGSIANVRSLSGYVRTQDGEMLAFSILANDFVIPAATVNWIADLGVEHLANFSRRR